MDEPAFCGCLVQSRLLGVIEGIQKEKNGKTERNDRLIAVAAESHTHSAISSVGDLDPNLLKEIEDFFVSYNRVRGKKFTPLGRHGPKRAKRLVEKQRAR
jgi:inorganic pyrophosphatase